MIRLLQNQLGKHETASSTARFFKDKIIYEGVSWEENLLAVNLEMGRHCRWYDYIINHCLYFFCLWSLGKRNTGRKVGDFLDIHV